MSIPKFRDSSIRFKLYALLIFCGVLSLILASVFLRISEGYSVRQGASHELKAEAEIIADGITAALAFGDEQAATAALTALREDASIIGGALYDDHGSLFASYAADSGTSSSCRATRRGACRRVLPVRQQRGLVWLPVSFQGRQIGTLAIDETLEDWEYYERQGAMVAELALLAALALAVMGASRLLKAITGPIAELSQLTRRVSLNQDYSARAERLSGGEIGVLVDSFNEMLTQIGARDEALRESEERFALAIRGANDGLWDWKASTGLLYMSCARQSDLRPAGRRTLLDRSGMELAYSSFRPEADRL